MFKYLKLSCVLFAAILILSFSAVQACPIIHDKSCCNEPCPGEECAVTKIKQVSATESSNTKEVVLNVKGMTCGGCANKVKGALANCEGVKNAQVNHKDGKAVVEVEKGKTNKEKLIEAVEKVGFTASEG
ncbi:MAG: heavy-metal-associated domain-containing protein [Candidatus Scalinduaceae bacterium]